MPKPAKGARLGSGPAHQKLLIRGLAADLITLERIRTSEAKAKMLRPHAERLITLAKTNTLHSRRRALGVIEDANVVHKLFDELGPRFAERNGGYTRIVKLGPRKGDAAPMAIIEFVEETELVAGRETEEAKAKRRGLLRKKRQEKGGKRGKKAEPAEAEEAEEVEEAEALASEPDAAEVAAKLEETEEPQEPEASAGEGSDDAEESKE